MNNDKTSVHEMAQISINTKFMRKLIDIMEDCNAGFQAYGEAPPFDSDDIKDLKISCDIAEDLHEALIEDIGIENF